MALQYRTIIEQAGVVDVSARGRLRVEGPDAVSFLHALVTNDVEKVTPGRGTYAAWLTPQGRMIADLRLFRDETGVWMEVPEGMGPAMQAGLDRLIFAEQVTVTDVSSSTEAALFIGHRAADYVAQATGLDVETLRDLPLWGHVAAGDTHVARVDDTALPTFALWRPKTTSGIVFGGAAGPSSQISAQNRDVQPPEGPETMPDVVFEGLRIEAGRPKFGVDMTAETIPLEAGLLDRAISQTKGCYVGQEVVIRILHRGGGRVARRLVRLQWPTGDGPLPAAGAEVTKDGRPVGVVTSAAVGPTVGVTVALAYVARDSAEEGVVLEVAGAGSAHLQAILQ